MSDPTVNTSHFFYAYHVCTTLIQRRWMTSEGKVVAQSATRTDKHTALGSSATPVCPSVVLRCDFFFPQTSRTNILLSQMESEVFSFLSCASLPFLFSSMAMSERVQLHLPLASASNFTQCTGLGSEAVHRLVESTHTQARRTKGR